MAYGVIMFHHFHMPSYIIIGHLLNIPNYVVDFSASLAHLQFCSSLQACR